MTSILPLEAALNILVILFFFIFWGVVFIVLYHLSRFGIGVKPKQLAAVFFLGSMVLFSISAIIYINIDIGSILQSI
jgi:hypothetical protein